MEKMECPHCGGAVGNEATFCVECGRELSDEGKSPRRENPGKGKHLYALLAVFLVVLLGGALLMVTGLIPNPLRDSSVAAVVNGEKINIADVDQRLEVYKKMFSSQGSEKSPEPLPEDLRRQVLTALIQEKILITEAARENITVSPGEIQEKISSIKKGMNLSDQAFDDFLKNHSMSSVNFEKRMEQEIRIGKLMEKGMKEKGLAREEWLNELTNRAKVEVLMR